MLFDIGKKKGKNSKQRSYGQEWDGMISAAPQAVRKLAKFLDYVLGRRPDEFGLVPDAGGYVKIRNLLQALHEDSEWRHIRQGHLQAVLLMQNPAVIEIEADAIRACERGKLPDTLSCPELPKILFTAVRRRAHPVVAEKGIRSGGPPVVLSSDAEMAARLGRRMDNDPVLLQVHTGQALSAGAAFRQYGSLYLAEFIPAQTFSGPPLPKEKTAPVPPRSSAPAEQPKTPGSFFPEPAAIENPGMPRRRKREVEWRHDRRRARKEKERRWK
jgi:putative RNA 2'-phosphotransferase